MSSVRRGLLGLIAVVVAVSGCVSASAASDEIAINRRPIFSRCPRVSCLLRLR